MSRRRHHATLIRAVCNLAHLPLATTPRATNLPSALCTLAPVAIPVLPLASMTILVLPPPSNRNPSLRGLVLGPPPAIVLPLSAVLHALQLQATMSVRAIGPPPASVLPLSAVQHALQLQATISVRTVRVHAPGSDRHRHDAVPTRTCTPIPAVSVHAAGSARLRHDAVPTPTCTPIPTHICTQIPTRSCTLIPTRTCAHRRSERLRSAA